MADATVALSFSSEIEHKAEEAEPSLPAYQTGGAGDPAAPPPFFLGLGVPGTLPFPGCRSLHSAPLLHFPFMKKLQTLAPAAAGDLALTGRFFFSSSVSDLWTKLHGLRSHLPSFHA